MERIVDGAALAPNDAILMSLCGLGGFAAGKAQVDTGAPP